MSVAEADAGSSGDSAALMRAITEGKNPRGIPGARFIDSIPDFLKTATIESTLGALNELYSKYKYMETSFEKSKSVYKSKLPEITQSIELIEQMKSKQEKDEELITQFNLSDTVYAKAKVDTEGGKVCLWMGANTMVEYTFDEALELLRTQKAQAIEKVAELNEDLQDLRANSITVEVNMARFFNYNVKEKKILAAAAAATGNEAK